MSFSNRTHVHFPNMDREWLQTFSAANQQRAVKIFWLHFWGSPMSLIHFVTRKMMYSIKHSGSNRTGAGFLFWFGSHFSCGHFKNDLKFSGSWCPEKNILQETETMSCFKTLLGISKTKQPCFSILASLSIYLHHLCDDFLGIHNKSLILSIN